MTSRWVPLPHTLTLELTSYCNLRCRMCPKTHHSVNTVENQVMSRDIFDRLSDILPFINNVELSGLWGEAFMHPDLYLYILGKLKQHPITVTTTSNGTLLTDDLARQLVEIGLDRLTISLDSAKAETYARLRPPGKREAVIHGLESLQRWKKNLARSLPAVELAFVGLRENIEEFPDFVRDAKRLGINKVVLQALGEYEGVRGESVADHFKDLGHRIFCESSVIAKEIGMTIELFPPDQFETSRQACGVPVKPASVRKDCLDPWTRAVISTTGDVLPCCASPLSMGNLGNQSFTAIWTSTPYANLRRSIRSDKPPAMCVACTGRPWTGKTWKQSFHLFQLLLGIHLNRRFGRSLLFQKIKPVLKKTRDRILSK